MIVDIPIHYHARSDGERSFNRRFAETVSLDIEEVGDELAPLALEWEFGKTRWYKGRHYRLLGQVFDPAGRGVDQASVLANFFSRERASTFGYFDTVSVKNDRKFSPRRYPEVADSGQRSEALRKSKALVDDAIIVDGGVWLRCGNPRFVFLPPYGTAGRWFGGHAVIETTEYTTDAGRLGKYVQRPRLSIAAFSCSINDSDTVAEFAKEFFVEPSPPVYSLAVKESVDELDPSDLLREAAAGLLEINDIPSSERAFVGDDLEGLRMLIVDRSSDDDEVADMLERILSRSAGFKSDDRALIARVCRRWNDRPMGIDFQASPIQRSRQPSV